MAKVILKGGPGSGHRGHAGRPGKRGGSVAGIGGPVLASSIDTYDDLKKFAITADDEFPLTIGDNPAYVHAVRYDSDIDGILESGIKPGPGGIVYASKGALRDRGSGFVIFTMPEGVAREGVDIVSATLSYPEFKFDITIPRANVRKVVRMARDRTGFEIREDQLAKYAMNNQGLATAEVAGLPLTYQRWFGLASVKEAVLKQLPIDDESKNNLIRARINIFYDASDNLAKRMFTGGISIGQWQEDMKSLIREVHTSAAAIGGGGWDEMSFAQWGRLGTPMREQYRYLQGFAEFIDENKENISLRAIQARSRLYGEGAGGSTVLIQAGPVLERLLPFLPKDGSTPCLNRCHCRWELEVTGTQPDGSSEVQAVWRLGIAEHCDVCVERDGHVEMLAVPRDGELPEVVGGIQ